MRDARNYIDFVEEALSIFPGGLQPELETKYPAKLRIRLGGPVDAVSRNNLPE